MPLVVLLSAVPNTLIICCARNITFTPAPQKRNILVPLSNLRSRLTRAQPMAAVIPAPHDHFSTVDSPCMDAIWASRSSSPIADVFQA